MVRQWLGTSRPNVPASLVVDVNNQFPHDHSVCERHHSCLSLQFAVHDEPRHQSFMDGAHVTNRIPNKVFASFNVNFMLNCRHKIHLGYQMYWQIGPSTSGLRGLGFSLQKLNYSASRKTVKNIELSEMVL